ncbi:hypothetical protein Bache_1558 [Bacteroides helcogenes P 36-108]|uniref:Uncharacterized protein n=1 Tax=Bacteroides helcogenes (strain ATCC 35417 / DSM 20613 / JCM 6297 / CCUG 15421 / P 36-108) TaxID=693979 RepID=E6SW88_BACT6|nr:hypothetical protein Bache_1558 [Bacteroides helcogenes P 36-108]
MPSAFRKAGFTSFLFSLINAAKIRIISEKHVLQHKNIHKIYVLEMKKRFFANLILQICDIDLTFSFFLLLGFAA